MPRVATTHRFSVYGTCRKSGVLRKLTFERSGDGISTRSRIMALAGKHLICPRMTSVDRIHRPVRLA
jgi:hypothetical protein